MNRDESRARGPEDPPTLRRADVAWLAPSDSERGGTWIAVNELGVVACLMNGYLAGESGSAVPKNGNRSRGEIIPWLMARGNAEEANCAFMRDFDPTPFPSFTLIVGHRNGVDSFVSRGIQPVTAMHTDEPWSHFTSSSWKTEEVASWRDRAFRQWLEQGAATKNSLPTFHLLYPDGMSEWSPLMDRKQTCTRSITQAELGFESNVAVMRYWPRTAIDAELAPAVHSLPFAARRNSHQNV